MPLKKYFRLFKNIFSYRLRLFWLVSVGILIFAVSMLSKIRDVECYLNSQICPEPITKSVGGLNGKNYFTINRQEIIASIDKIQPVDEISISFLPSGKLTLNLKSEDKYHEISIYYLTERPQLSMDSTMMSSESAIFRKPSEEIREFLSDKSPTTMKLWSNGVLTSSTSTSTRVSMVIGHNPTPDFMVKIYDLIDIAKSHEGIKTITITDNLIFLSQEDQPDIITLVPYDEAQLKRALSSLSFLISIKKEARVIDLRFKNPIIR